MGHFSRALPGHSCQAPKVEREVSPKRPVTKRKKAVADGKHQMMKVRAVTQLIEEDGSDGSTRKRKAILPEGHAEWLTEIERWMTKRREESRWEFRSPWHGNSASAALP
jgi:hypothetical protein